MFGRWTIVGICFPGLLVGWQGNRGDQEQKAPAVGAAAGTRIALIDREPAYPNEIARTNRTMSA